MRHRGNHVVIDLPSQAPPQASPGSRCDWQALGADQAAMARTTPSLPRAYDVVVEVGGGGRRWRSALEVKTYFGPKSHEMRRTETRLAPIDRKSFQESEHGTPSL